MKTVDFSETIAASDLKGRDANDDPGVTLTYFTARSNLVILAFPMGKNENSGFFRNYCSQ